MASNVNAAPAIPGVELVGVIGSGGSGVVYLGHQKAFGREVAVKVGTHGPTPDDATRRWEREVAAVGRLSNHPNIVPVFDAGVTDDGSPYMVMPYVPGGTLGDRLRDEGPMDAEEVAGIGAKLAATLATVHAAGVLHRDIKPDNVLWSPHGEPQLTDFGIASLQDLTTTFGGDLHATIAYAAPEVLAGKPATEAADVYGLGATLYACLTGSSPHPSQGGEGVAGLVARVLEQAPPALTGTSVPRALAEVVDRAMRRDPQERQASAADLADELRTAKGDLAGGAEATEHLVATTAVTPEVPTQVSAAAAAPAQRMSVPAPVPTPAPSRPPGPPPGPTTERSRSWGLWAAMLAVLVLFVGLVAFGMRSDGDDREGGDPAATETESDDTSVQASETTAAPEQPTETVPDAAPTDSADDEAEPSGDATAAAVNYIETLDRGELDEAWSLTTSRFQSQQDREQWESFWGGYDQIAIVGDPRFDADAGTVVVPLSLDGQREDYRLDVVEQGGAWLIDGPVGR
jgi:serine/threonine-protein kinase PknK